jgi:cytoskeletal protein RodZ
MQFLEILFIIIVSFYILGWLGRWWLRRYMKRVQKKMQQFQQQQYQARQPKPEGQVNVDVKPKQEKIYTRDEGEYVDFEEINDD